MQPRSVRITVIVGAALLAAGTSPTAAAQVRASRPHVKEVIRSTADFLAAQKHLRVHSENLHDEVMPWGQKIQFAGAADYFVSRPNRIAIDYRDDVSARRFWYDGAKLVLFDPLRGFYARLAMSMDLDETVDDLESRVGLVLPLATLLANDTTSALGRGVRDAHYIGISDVEGVACHHVAMIGETIDWQLWVEIGDKPLPRKHVITYKTLPHSPQAIAVLMDWSFDEIPAGVFSAELPEGATKIDFLQVRGAAR